MERFDVTEKIRLILIAVLKHEKFEMNNELKTSEIDGWDSLSNMTIISEIETCFNTKFKLRELNKLNSIGSIIEVVQSKL